MTKDLFFDRPYSDRQLILFVDDIVIATNEEARRSTEAQGNFSDVFKATMKKKESTILRKMLTAGDSSKSRLEQVLWGLSGISALPMALMGIAGAALVETMLSYREAKSQGVENFQLVGKSKIPLFRLPPGHPRDRMVYAGHPAIPSVYVPLADFHRLTFEHKFSEVISLLMHLGAKTIKVEHVTGWSVEFASRLAVGIPVTPSATDVGIEGGFKRGNEQALLFHAAFNNKHTPHLPVNLVWYPYEATWQQVVDGRMNFGLSNFLLHLNYNNDFGINASLKLKIENAGLELGGSFEELTATTWRISGDFQ